MSLIQKLRDRLFGIRMPDLEDVPRIHREESDRVPDEKSGKMKPHTDKSNVSCVGTRFPERVLFVCSGNMCRSPYGAARFADLAGNRKVQVVSAGTLRLVGRGAAPEMVKTAAENGLNLEAHRSNALSKMLIQASDVIFVMELIHRQEVLRLCPEAADKIILLGNWLPTPVQELVDPMGKTPDVYREVAAQIDAALENWFGQWKTPDDSLQAT
ncbi:MAG: hypothetical protein IJU23_14835 [Proteobacteria bacterium]|nr:hypothetical protein [Pseudomonadota bacterium]